MDNKATVEATCRSRGFHCPQGCLNESNIGVNPLCRSSCVQYMYPKHCTCFSHQVLSSAASWCMQQTQFCRRSHCSLRAATAFLLPSSVEQRPPLLRLNEGGVVHVHYNDIQAPFILPLSNGLWTANAAPSGGRSLLITPPIPTRSPPQ